MSFDKGATALKITGSRALRLCPALGNWPVIESLMLSSPEQQLPVKVLQWMGQTLCRHL